MSAFRWFRNIFAESGDVAAIPDQAPPGGEVSYDSGFGADYDKELGVDPQAKAMPRSEFNQLMKDSTGNIKCWQNNTYPDFAPAADNGGVAVDYPFGSRVRYDDGGGIQNYEVIAVAGATTLPTDPSEWRLVTTKESIPSFFGDFGAADAYVLVPLGAVPTEYKEGMRVRFIADNPNTGASTVNIAGLGVKAIVQDFTGSVALAAGNLSGFTELEYNGSEFVLLSFSRNINGQISGNAETTTLAENASLLEGSNKAYYRSLANSTGTLPDARLTGNYTGLEITPTSKKSQQEKLGIYSIGVTSGGSATKNTPTGWSVVRDSLGLYTISTGTINPSTQLTSTATVFNSTNTDIRTATIVAEGSGSFQVAIRDGGNTLIDHQFYVHSIRS